MVLPFQTVPESGPSDGEDTPLVTPALANLELESITSQYYVIQEKIEMGEMASLFFSKVGVTLFYICLAIYLYGDLSIYGAAIAQSMTDVACTNIPENHTCNSTVPISYDELCWKSYYLTRLDAYRLFLVSSV